MRTVAADFSRKIAEVERWIDLVNLTFDLAATNFAGFRSRHKVASAARAIQSHAVSLGTFRTVIAYEGAFLTACAEFELAVRGLIEKFVDAANMKKASFLDLPERMRQWHSLGCARIMQNLDQDKFSHLTLDRIVYDLHSCLPASAGGTYTLRPEAYSDHERNFRSDVLSESIKRLGVRDLWRELSTGASLQTFFGTAVAVDTQRQARDLLNLIMTNRNRIIHRGRSAYAPSDSDVRECIHFFNALVQALASVMTGYLARI